MRNSRAQIVATVGPVSSNRETLRKMALAGLDVLRLNFSWGTETIRINQIKLLREIEKEVSRRIPIIADLPGLRIQKGAMHTYNHEIDSILTDADKESIKFAIDQKIDYIALSFVGKSEDVEEYRNFIDGLGGRLKVIAKIERAMALQSLDPIIAASHAVMVARGDLGEEVPLERIPFIQEKIIRKCKKAEKPVIVATQMMLSMVTNPAPTRAEVTDVANAILFGADAVMLSEETAIGKYPAEAIVMMEKIILEAEQHMDGEQRFNTLQ